MLPIILKIALFVSRDGQCTEYSGEEQSICAAGLARVKPGIFIEAIQYILVVATPVEVLFPLLPSRFSPCCLLVFPLAASSVSPLNPRFWWSLLVSCACFFDFLCASSVPSLGCSVAIFWIFLWLFSGCSVAVSVLFPVQNFGAAVGDSWPFISLNLIGLVGGVMAVCFPSFAYKYKMFV
ncbi:hypothetical protein IEQ34_018586 [Dendrobium chrysotoxum]|uniref:Nucleoporin Nup133/Nup155-like N-terminal domain-containing protein n=1 Tax=Dendrobium chrysotoxum TaxID=161865 RepID=A0AAV7G508_DENCH|nr:hypothetical protein IEQ34_018586 [Dendrobium chrysotoxum]